MKDIPAFPAFFGETPVHPESFQPGMTLRDYFAAKAMHALIVDGVYDRAATGNESVSEYAYQIADAMLAERQKGQP